jgi:hypothetical protein
MGYNNNLFRHSKTLRNIKESKEDEFKAKNLYKDQFIRIENQRQMFKDNATWAYDVYQRGNIKRALDILRKEIFSDLKKYEYISKPDNKARYLHLN